MSIGTIPLPDTRELDQMAQSIAGCNYEQLAPEHRVLVMQCTIDNERNGILSELEDNLRPLAEWFKLSKLYEP